MKLDRWIIFGGGLAVFLIGAGNYWGTTWLSKWAIFLGLLNAGMCFWAARRTSLFYLPLMLYVVLHLVTLSLWPVNPYSGILDDVALLALQKNAAVALLQFNGCLLLFCLLRAQATRGVYELLALITLVGALGTLSLPLTGPFSAPNNGMWFGNPSMGASLLACLLPFLWIVGAVRLKSFSYGPLVWVFAMWVVVLGAIACTHASVPWGVLGVVTGVFFIRRATKRGRYLVLAGVGMLGAGMIYWGRAFLGPDFWDQNGRFEIWSMAWAWFRAHGNIWFGMGYSTTQILLPVEQVVTGHFRGDYFLWLHNDWLQLAIEGGVVGALCTALALSRLLVAGARHATVLASLSGFVTLACFNYPLRMPIHSMALVLVCGMVEAWAAIPVTVEASESVQPAAETVAESHSHT